MKMKSPLLLVIAIAASCVLFSDTARASQGGTLPEDNSSTNSVVDDHGGLSNTNSNSGSGKNKGGFKKDVVMKINLVAAPGIAPAKGTARFRDRANGKKQDIQVEVQVSRSLVGTIYGVTVGDTVIGTMTINPLGKGKLELSTEHGNVVPAVVPGTLIGVLDGNGAVILAGQF